VTGESGGPLIFGATSGPFRIISVFDVRSGPEGQNPTGTVRIDLDSTAFGRIPRATYDVTRLSVTGNGATVGGVAQDPIAARPLFPNVVWAITDRGAGGPDGLLFGCTPPPTCPPDVLPPEGGVTGDVTVHDAPNLPSNPSQCKDGGWRNFRGFKNQGQCVAFVQRGPRPGT
jgi:hypothetical protein